jgi:ribosomal protein S18 acetylase RimI-like enzyme
MSIEPVPESRIPEFRQMVEDYWWEIMRTADGVRDEASRTDFFNKRFRWDPDHTPPYWMVKEDRPMAFIQFSIESKKAMILNFYVDPSARRQGVGSQLVDWLTGHLDERGITQIDLTVRRDNPASLAFWESRGYMIGHHQMSMFRDPTTGTAYKGALSSDFTPEELGFEPWTKR